MTEMPGESEEELASRRKEMLSGEKGWKAPIDWVNGPRKTVDYVLIDGVNAGSGGEIRVGKLKSSQRMFQERMDFSRWIDAGKLLRSGHGVTSERCGRRLGRLRRERRRKVERKVRRLRLQRSSRRAK